MGEGNDRSSTRATQRTNLFSTETFTIAFCLEAEAKQFTVSLVDFLKRVLMPQFDVIFNLRFR